MNTTVCPTCGATLGISEWPFCPHGRGGYTSVPDDIPGGLWVENLGRDPVKVHSHSERRRIMKARGLQECVRHTPMPGTDKSKFTTSWATSDPYTLEQARILAERQATTRGTNDPPLTVEGLEVEWIEGRGLADLKVAIERDP